jgi:hypothetical protein
MAVSSPIGGRSLSASELRLATDFFFRHFAVKNAPSDQIVIQSMLCPQNKFSIIAEILKVLPASTHPELHRHPEISERRCSASSYDSKSGHSLFSNPAMTFDWSGQEFDEWDIPMRTEPVPQVLPLFPPSPPGQFPDVEIGSSSDEDAPERPKSAVLARENLQLRSSVVQLAAQAKSLEKTNHSLKSQLVACRDRFKSQVKPMFARVFK